MNSERTKCIVLCRNLIVSLEFVDTNSRSSPKKKTAPMFALPDDFGATFADTHVMVLATSTRKVRCQLSVAIPVRHELGSRSSGCFFAFPTEPYTAVPSARVRLEHPHPPVLRLQ